jgi:hypothetical protein
VGATGRWTTGAATCLVTSAGASWGVAATVRGGVRAARRLVATSGCGTARAATEPTVWLTTDGRAETDVSAALGRSTSGGTINDSDSPSAAMSLAAGVRRVATIVRRSALGHTGQWSYNLENKWYPRLRRIGPNGLAATSVTSKIILLVSGACVS